MKLRTRIFIAMLAITVVTFLVTGVVAAYDHYKHDEVFNQQNIIRKEKAIRASLEYLINQHAGTLPPDSVSFYLGDKICELSDVHKMFITIYDLKGDYLVSENSDTAAALHISDELESGLVQRIISETKNNAIVVPSAYNEKMNIAYWCFRDDFNRPLAIMAMLYKKEENQKHRMLVFLTEIGTPYLVLFVIAALLAFVISRDITKPLNSLSQRLNHVKLGSLNEPLEWKSNDEIGQLIQEYNSMLYQLETSANKLAQQERETAWREMAQQVAHEIKNPLTPMKLRLQHLQRSWADNPEVFQERLNDFVESMSDQIDTLSRIAEEFSHFAKMPQTKYEHVSINSICNSVIQTFQHENESVNFHRLTQETVTILGDKTQLIRVLNNLINNAFQAIPTDKEKRITLTMGVYRGHCVIKVSDNGIGITDEIGKRIFMPNFTTRSTGSGLGLAMVKSMVNQMGGTVAYRTRINKGSSFFLFFPIIKNELARKPLDD